MIKLLAIVPFAPALVALITPSSGNDHALIITTVGGFFTLLVQQTFQAWYRGRERRWERDERSRKEQELADLTKEEASKLRTLLVMNQRQIESTVRLAQKNERAIKDLGSHWPSGKKNNQAENPIDKHLKFENLIEPSGAYVVVTPEDYQVVAVSDSYLKLTHTFRKDLIGFSLFGALALREDDNQAREVIQQMLASLDWVKHHRQTDAMSIQRYPIKTNKGWEDRYWSTVNSPILGPAEELSFIVHKIEDVTDFVRAQGVRHSTENVG